MPSSSSFGWCCLDDWPLGRAVYRQHHTARAHMHTFLSAHFTRDHTCGSRHFACLKSHFVIGHVFAEHSFNPVSSYFSSPTTSLTPPTTTRSGMDCLALWPVRSQTQVMSPSSASLSVASTPINLSSDQKHQFPAGVRRYGRRF